MTDRGMTHFDPSRFEALTFDCYGTIIDWERGIRDALGELLGRPADGEEGERLLEAFGRLESEAEAGPFRPYRAVLTDVGARLAAEEGVDPTADTLGRFAGSVGRWPPFPDSTAALTALGGRFRLAIVSNVDDDLFAGSAERLGISFDEVVTAEQVESYKPARAHFDEVLRRLDLPRERVLHCAQSLYHDVSPARALGFTTVWVNRRAGRVGGGATPRGSAEPHLEVPDLETLAGILVHRGQTPEG